jgi:hypothetical protein
LKVGGDESHRHKLLRQSSLNAKLRVAKLLGSVSLCQSDRCLFDSDRLGVDRFAVIPESIFAAQTLLAHRNGGTTSSIQRRCIDGVSVTSGARTTARFPVKLRVTICKCFCASPRRGEGGDLASLGCGDCACNCSKFEEEIRHL